MRRWAIFALVLLLGCAADDPEANPAAGVPDVLDCPMFDPPVALGTVTGEALVELSGLAASRTLPGVLWTHNDAGDDPRVFAIGLDGAVLAEHAVRGAEAVDWEDIAVGPGPDGASHLFLADVGDNEGARSEIVVYRIAEPAAADGRDLVAAPIVLRYPGVRRNAEALLVDPRTGDLVIVTKLPSGHAEVLVAPAPHEGPQVLQPRGEIEAGAPVTGADVDPTGSRAMLRTMAGARWIPRGEDEPLGDALLGPGCPLALDHETQGEAIAWDVQGRGWLTVQEAEAPTLWLVAERW